MSYKETLIGFNGVHFDDNKDMDDKEFESDDEGEGDQNCIMEDSNNEMVVKDLTYLTIQISKEERAELCKSWKLTLIVKLLRKRLGMKFIKMRL